MVELSTKLFNTLRSRIMKNVLLKFYNFFLVPMYVITHHSSSFVITCHHLSALFIILIDIFIIIVIVISWCYLNCRFSIVIITIIFHENNNRFFYYRLFPRSSFLPLLLLLRDCFYLLCFACSFCLLFLTLSFFLFFKKGKRICGVRYRAK